MALETANDASELNENNPTSTDLVKSADDHIRMLKRILKKGFQGHFTSLSVVRALTSVDGSWFTYNGDTYSIVTSTLTESLPEIIKLTDGRIAVRQTSFAFPKDVTLPTASTQKRYPRVEKITATSFDLTAVNAAFGGTPVRGDVAIVLGENFAETRIFSTAWVNVDSNQYGDQSFVGTAYALAMAAPLGIFKALRTQRIELLSATHLELMSPDGIGPDSLRYWFGLNTDVVDGNGNIAYNSISKANAIEWKSLTTGGTNGNSTPVDGGAVVSALGLGSSYLCEQGSSSGYAEEDARVVFGVNGAFSVHAYGDVVDGSPATGNYVTTPSASTGALYEVMFEKLSGDTVVGTLATWQALSSPRQISVPATRSTVGATTRTASIRITVRKIGDAGTAVAHTVSLSARAVVYTSGTIEP